MNRPTFNVSSVYRILAMAMIAFGLCFGGTQAAFAATGNDTPTPCTGVDCSGDQGVSGYLTLVGPRGQQVAIYCADGTFQYAVMPSPSRGGNFSVSTSAVALQCDSQVIFSLYPGYRLVINPDPMIGWVYDRWERSVRICQDGMMLTVYSTPAGTRPEYKAEMSKWCGYVPSPGA